MEYANECYTSKITPEIRGRGFGICECSFCGFGQYHDDDVYHEEGRSGFFPYLPRIYTKEDCYESRSNTFSVKKPSHWSDQDDLCGACIPVYVDDGGMNDGPYRYRQVGLLAILNDVTISPKEYKSAVKTLIEELDSDDDSESESSSDSDGSTEDDDKHNKAGDGDDNSDSDDKDYNSGSGSDDNSGDGGNSDGDDNSDADSGSSDDKDSN